MDLISRIASWLGENEATISAVVGIVVTARGSSFTYKVKVLDAIGLERFITQILQIDNVKWVTLFPRDKNRLTP